jgi:hypothetical protein
VWHHHNNIVHGDGKASIAASIPYLKNYFDSFTNIAHAISDTKGKTPMPSDNANMSADSSVVSRWIAPEVGILKANVDDGWDSITKKGGIGIIVRDHRGSIVSSAWRFLPRCTSAEEAEITACVEGLNSLIQLQCTSAVVEMDCSRVV